MTGRRWFQYGVVGLAVGLAAGLAGCSTYTPVPLPERANLVSNLNQLNLAIPSQAKVDPTKPLTPDQVGLVAVLNDPELASQRAKIEQAHADELDASILPNPSVTLGDAFLTYSPPAAGAIYDALTASISQDIVSIITYGPRTAAAEARFKQVSTDAIWDEWQVAQKARMDAIAINAEDAEIKLRENDLAMLTSEIKEVEKATQAGNLDLTTTAPLLATLATDQHDLAAVQVQEVKDWQDLDSLLGLQPTARFAISEPEEVKVPDSIDPLIASLPHRRPDLIALQLGYEGAEQDARAAILAQFPAFALGAAGGSDTSGVVSVGPQVTFDLPIFNRNQAKVLNTKATREQLHAEYQSRLDDAEGTARSLLIQMRIAAKNLAGARKALTSAQSVLKSAETAYRQGNINQRDLTDFQSTARDREVDVIDYERQMQENALGLAVELGVGFPPTLITRTDQETRS
ncbi:MAG TPA: TolC family protein [Stellaceae bacterium]|nr:TolC family protein [Stellaceae bacterium]